jgi:hypothetical protein
MNRKAKTSLSLGKKVLFSIASNFEIVHYIKNERRFLDFLNLCCVYKKKVIFIRYLESITQAF